VQRRAAGDGDDVVLTLGDGRELVGDELLVAVGRRPATRDLGLEAIGLEAGGYLPVDDRMRVAGHDWLYAIGDANGRSLLTHMGKVPGARRQPRDRRRRRRPRERRTARGRRV